MCIRDRCMMMYGVYMGDQPDGQMTHSVNKSMHCEGYDDVGTIQISYSLPSGVRNGQRYHGTARVAFLPDNEEGREVLKLLKAAFDRRLIFTIGTSVTTGANNCVVWNGIHHKTSIAGGTACWGYPDQTYLSRVKEELASKGVTPDSLNL
eukprot:TRINITY_DN6249_c0_g1_i2.p2 TRINITY_DN6249_c0_g1~~TRINITY_DN6249_c0_g1_i2.p2  ORF type:complete len:150 (+),score=20.00 TRINITY_DN6249_c0_g1_i2:63-512(+)